MTKNKQEKKNIKTLTGQTQRKNKGPLKKKGTVHCVTLCCGTSRAKNVLCASITPQEKFICG